MATALQSATVPWPPSNDDAPSRLRRLLDMSRPAAEFAGKLFGILASLPFLIGISLMPISSLLLMLPAFLPEETVMTDDAPPIQNRWEHERRRLIACAMGFATFVALLVTANELVVWLRLVGVLRWVSWVVFVYLLDLAVLLLVGRVPVRYNTRNLLVRWRITLLTALAFTVVVALLTVMLAFVAGMYKVTEESGQPANVLIMGDGSTDEVFSTLAYSDVDKVEVERTGLGVDEEPLPDSIGVKKEQINGRLVALASKETYAIAVQNLPNLGKKRFVQIRGIVEPELAARVHDLKLLNGRWFSASGVQTPPGAKPGERDRVEVVMGAGVAREFGKSAGKATLGPGDEFDLSDRVWIVVGVMDSDGTTFGSELWAKQNLVANYFNKKGYNSMSFRVDGAGTREELIARADAMAYHLANRFSNPKVAAQTELEYFNKQSETNKQFLYAIIFVAAIMAVGGVFGVMNTMFAAIAQRTKDIGVMRILGFKRWQILVSFLLESLGIALIGGLLGCALGLIADGWSATSSISSGQGGGKTVILRLAVDAKVLMTGILFTLVMGRLGGLVPALSAMRMKALDLVR